MTFNVKQRNFKMLKFNVNLVTNFPIISIIIIIFQKTKKDKLKFMVINYNDDSLSTPCHHHIYCLYFVYFIILTIVKCNLKHANFLKLY